jgi:hypothetical protein
MTLYFFDTSALVKRYHQETGTERVNAIFDSLDNTLVISELTLVELASALERKRNEGKITKQAMNDTLSLFANEVLSDFIVAGFRSGFIQQARDLVLQYSLRTLDALLLTAAMGFKTLSPVFVCADTQLHQVALDVGLEVLNPTEIA